MRRHHRSLMGMVFRDSPRASSLVTWGGSSTKYRMRFDAANEDQAWGAGKSLRTGMERR
jgi:hypothetical protein